MFNFKNLFPQIAHKPQAGITIGAVPGMVVIIHNKRPLYMTPELAHKLADVLPRFAQLAKDMK